MRLPEDLHEMFFKYSSPTILDLEYGGRGGERANTSRSEGL
jgi:hypothetical protein